MLKKLLSLLFIVFLFSVSALANAKYINLKLEYDGQVHNYNEQQIFIELNGKLLNNLEIEPIILNGRTLVPLRETFEKMGATVSWDKETREAIIQNSSKKVAFKINESYAIVNDTEKVAFDVPSKIINGSTMIPLRAIANSLNYFVDWDNSTRTVKINSSNTNDSLSDQVTSSEGNIESTTSEITTTTETVLAGVNQKQDGIKIVWDQISNVKANDLASKRKPIKGLDVISPTWFAIKDSEGNLLDKGSIEYSKWAKEQGYQIWGLVTNSFDKTITHNTLSDSKKRTKIINKLLEYAKKYSLDGINIDFESVDKKDGTHYLQFIKEATKAFKNAGLIVSVDMYVPTPWTSHYQMAEVAKIVDYVIIMAYDEHYSTSKESGSVSSMGWVDKYMKEASKLVPKDKLIMGVPFYTRVWTEEKTPNGSVKVSSKSLTMDEAKDLLKQNNANLTWLEDTGQYYGEYVSNGTTKKIWVEDEKSMEERMKISRKYDVKGIAGWKRGHENDKTWDIINSYYK